VPNILKALRAEIRQVAKSESKRAAKPMRDQLTGIRRSLTSIERRLAGLRVGHLGAGSSGTMRGVAGDGRRARFAPALMKQHRTKVGLSRKAYAHLMGVSSLSIYFWETGRTTPRREAVLAWQTLRKLGSRELRRRAGVSTTAVTAKKATARGAKATATKKRTTKKRATKTRTTKKRATAKPAAKKRATKKTVATKRIAKKRAARSRRPRRGVRAKAA
jgi:DNA-binding XRE family transcriptional regulator